MATNIKKTSVANRVPNTFVLSTDGDIGVNTHDGKMYISNSSNVFEVGANISGNVTIGGNISIGNTIIASTLLTLGGQVNANGGVGTAGQVLTSGAAGNAHWTTLAASVAGSNSQIQFNANGVLSADAGFTIDGVTDTVTLGGAAQTTAPKLTVSNTTTSANLTSATLTIGNSSVNTIISAANASFGGNVSIANEITNVRGIRFDRDNPVVDPLIPTPQEGLMTWNPIEQCLDIHQNDTTLQVGLEHMTLFKNTTGATIVDGTVLEVIGANGDGNPTVALFTANSAADSLHVIGVCTESVANGALGRATKFGKIRGLNTTGSTYSETWSVGTELFVSPTVAGGLTSIKPSPPNQAIFIGTVTKLGTTDGIILINTPTITKLRYGVFSDTTTQSAVAANTAYPIKFNTTDFAAGHSVASRYTGSNNAIVAAVSGLYNYQFSLQFSSTTNQTRDIWIWPRKNNSDIPNSATRISITDQTTYVVAAWNFVVSMQANDDFQLMWAASQGSNVISITAFSATAFCPAIPSCILTVTQASI